MIEGERSWYKIYRITASGLSFAIFLGLTIYVFFVYHDISSLFFLHPTFMTLGFVLLMSDAILALKDNLLLFLFPKLQKTVKHQHWVLQVLGAIFILTAFVVMVVLKDEDSGNHFSSYHAIIGLIAVICCFVACFGGIFTFYAVKLKNIMKPAHNKLGHTMIGTFSFAIGIVAQGTGFYTKAFGHSTNSSIQIACTVLMSLASLVVLEGAIMTAWSKIRRL